jgi:hypothetical protein
MIAGLCNSQQQRSAYGKKRAAFSAQQSARTARNQGVF